MNRTELKKLLNYNPETGEFRWAIARQRITKGSVAGTAHIEGYVQLWLNGKAYLAHRLAWLYVHGYEPTEIDHINRIRNDNRIVNLREVSRTENNLNASIRKDNTSGYKGVSWNKTRNKWQAYIKIKGKKKSLGYHHTAEEAHIARVNYEKLMLS